MCVSPFEAVSSVLDWVTSIPSLPISVMQAFCLQSRSGGSDAWLEDPKQSCIGARFAYELAELLEIVNSSRSYTAEDPLPASLPAKLMDELKKFDMNDSNSIPLELLRSYIKRDDPELSNNQVSLAFWSICRGRGLEQDLIKTALGEERQEISRAQGQARRRAERANQRRDREEDAKWAVPGEILPDIDDDTHTGGDHTLHSNSNPDLNPDTNYLTLAMGSPSRSPVDMEADSPDLNPIHNPNHNPHHHATDTYLPDPARGVDTHFEGDSRDYLRRFDQDVGSYLSTMASLDANVVLGMLPAPLNPSASHEIVSDAMRLDPSAKNGTPPSACIW